jgi:hypothetical protein
MLVRSNTLLSLALIFALQWTKSVNFFMLPPHSIGVLSNEYCGMFKGP